MTDPEPLPAGGPATLAAAKVELSIPADDVRDDARITAAVAAVNAMLTGHGDAAQAWPVTIPARGAADWTAAELSDCVLGANRLAGRLYKRGGSPLGYELQGDLGPVYVSRNDPDLAQLLGLGGWQPPRYQVG
jgi:hypothetical protein